MPLTHLLRFQSHGDWCACAGVNNVLCSSASCIPALPDRNGAAGMLPIDFIFNAGVILQLLPRADACGALRARGAAHWKKNARRA